jgi:hypothetical protein
MPYARPFLLAVLLGLVAGGAFAGELVLIRSARVRLSLIERDVALIEEERAALDQLRALAEETSDDRAALRSALVPQDGVVRFLKRIEDLGKHAGITLTVEAVSTAAPSPEAGFEDLSVRFAAEGPFNRIVHLIALVESLPVAAIVESARLEVAGVGDEPTWKTVVFLRALKERGE